MFRFLRDYDELFPVEDDVSLLQQASSTLYPLLSPCFTNLDTLLDSSMAVAFLLLLPLVKLNDQQQRIEKPSLKKRDSGESQYHRMVDVGRDLWRSPGSTPRRHGLGNYCKMHSYFKVRSEYEHLEREKLP